ncbi:hypothetical protein HMPREF0017_01114 [Acinetobacter lwoffii SH145]|nr:hypothetical protein HMPREF0017_01114 [Acinetobacter lwoffii SH145]
MRVAMLLFLFYLIFNFIRLNITNFFRFQQDSGENRAIYDYLSLLNRDFKTSFSFLKQT